MITFKTRYQSDLRNSLEKQLGLKGFNILLLFLNVLKLKSGVIPIIFYVILQS
jgi:hypothetical protein